MGVAGATLMSHSTSAQYEQSVNTGAEALGAVQEEDHRCVSNTRLW
jgi:hypothetical protein